MLNVNWLSWLIVEAEDTLWDLDWRNIGELEIKFARHKFHQCLERGGDVEEVLENLSLTFECPVSVIYAAVKDW